ncbi:response regulator [Candidatus Berkiella aquae]|uniref:Response regulator n=1 Tax=Candidatus Berkiella aquae TaxID=295108 RepID=A0A0Q9YLH0_9GAMM|nr:response regulator [Candidatus Berkiella aquae]MCS5711527.1 response regulator [Candidatus Berkiella aquae]
MPLVLIVDDRAINREYVQSILQYLSYTTLEAKNGIEAFAIVKKERPHLIISDILMPEMDGYEFVRELKKIESLQNIPVIFYTATYRKEEASLLAKDLGVEFILSKPSDPQVMIDTIQQALGVKKETKFIASPLIETQSDLRTNLYHAPQKLIEISTQIHHSLNQINQLKKMFEQTAFSAQEKNALLALTHDLANDMNTYRTLHRDLFSLIELTIEMISQKDALKLLQLFCHGTRKSVDATFGIACIIDDKNHLQYIATSGNDDLGFNKNLLVLDNPFIKDILQARSAFTKENIQQHTISWHNANLINALCSPIMTSNQVYGFAYFINKKHHRYFGEEEFRMLDTLVSELAILYENIALYETIQQQTVKLKIEGSKLKAVKDELQESEIMFRQFAENTNEVFWRTTASLDKLIYISPGYETIWGKSTDSIYHNPASWQETVIEEDKTKVVTHIKELISTKENASLEYRINHPTGSIRSILNKTIFIKDNSGELLHIIGIASDITEYLQNQKENILENELVELLEKNDSLTQIIPRILQTICKIFEWKIGELWLIDEQNKVLQNIGIWHKKKKAYAFFDAATVGTTLTMEEDFPGLIWQHRQAMRFGQYSSHPLFKRANIMHKLQLHDALGVPLLYQDKVLGIMHFFSQQIAPIDDNFHRILSMLGTRISEFIHQKTTHEQLLQLVKRGSYRIIF